MRARTGAKAPRKNGWTIIQRPSPRSRAASALGEFQLDAAITTIGARACTLVDRLELAEAVGGKPLRWHPLGHEELNDGDRARRGQLPVGREQGGVDRLPIRVAVDLQDPIDGGRDAVGALTLKKRGTRINDER